MLRARAQRLLVPLTLAVVALALALATRGETAAPPAAPSGDVVSGRIELAHQDTANPAHAHVVPLLVTARGPIALNLSDGLWAKPGSLVHVRNPRYRAGAIVGGALMGPPTIPSADPTLGPANFTAGPKTVLVLLAQIAGQPAPGSADAIRNVIFGASNSANAFIQQESYGQLSLTGKLRPDGDVYGTYQVTNPSGTCDPVDWGNQAESAFKSQTGMNAETWNHVIVIFQMPEATCDFSGEGEIGHVGTVGPARHVWINAVLTNGVPTTSVVAHELGHNFGVDHAGGFDCYAGSTRIAFSLPCAADPHQIDNQYADPFDVMGNVDEGVREENAYHRWESGWLPSSAVQKATTSGTYLVAPIESASTAVQLLEVPRASGAPSYWLDFRQPLAGVFDDFAANDPAVNGVTIRYANSSTMSHPSKSWLIDTTPATATFADAPLAVGSTYTDPTYGVSITTLAVSPLGALVRVVDRGDTDTTAPSPPSGLAVAFSGGAINLSWNASSDDHGLVQHYVVTRNGAQIADAFQTGYSDTAPLVGQTATYTVQAVDPSGNISAPVSVVVTIADTTAPGAPAALAAATQGQSVSLAWAPATDDVGVVSYEVDRDGAALARGLTATTFADPAVPYGTHVYTVRGFDAAGNAGALATVSVTLVAPAAVAPKAPKLKKVATLKLKRLGKHRVLVSWKKTKGAKTYQVLRPTTKKNVLLATVKKPQYVDGKAAVGKLSAKRYLVRAVIS